MVGLDGTGGSVAADSPINILGERLAIDIIVIGLVPDKFEYFKRPKSEEDF